MKQITSLFDYFQKAKRDKRYEKVAIKAYQESDFGSRRAGGWSEAKNWIDNWTKTNVKEHGDSTCERMVRYLNDTMRKIPNWQDESLSEPRLDIPKPT
jgi:hypothetical protein